MWILVVVNDNWAWQLIILYLRTEVAWTLSDLLFKPNIRQDLKFYQLSESCVDRVDCMAGFYLQKIAANTQRMLWRSRFSEALGAPSNNFPVYIVRIYQVGLLWVPGASQYVNYIRGCFLGTLTGDLGGDTYSGFTTTSTKDLSGDALVPSDWFCFYLIKKERQEFVCHPGFAIDCPCGVWCRVSTTCLMYVGPHSGNLV